ncbi:MAG: AI-2E family transporter [Nannocystaceae bacterium]
MDDTPQPGGSAQPVRRSDSPWGFLRRFSRLWGFAVFLVFVVVLFRQIVLPFVFAVLVAYLLAPSVRRMQPRVGRAGAVIILYLGILGVLGTFLGVLLPRVSDDLRVAAPELVAKLNDDWIPRGTEWIESTFSVVPAAVEDVSPKASELKVSPTADGGWRVDLRGVRLRVHETSDGGWLIEPPGEGRTSMAQALRELVASKGSELTLVLGRMAQAVLAGVGSFLTKFVITFMLAGFLLVDLERVNGFVRSLVPREYQDDFDEIVLGMDAGMSGVVRGQLMICVVNGTLTYVGLLLIGVKYSLLLALTAAIFSLIPIFGTIISSAPVLAVALVSDPTGGKALGMAAWIAGIHLVEANFLNPKIIGTSAHIHPVVVVFALLAGESVFGLTGALLAVPTVSVIQTLFLFARRRSAAVRGRGRDRELEFKPKGGS